MPAVRWSEAFSSLHERVMAPSVTTPWSFFQVLSYIMGCAACAATFQHQGSAASVHIPGMVQAREQGSCMSNPSEYEASSSDHDCSFQNNAPNPQKVPQITYYCVVNKQQPVVPLGTSLAVSTIKNC